MGVATGLLIQALHHANLGTLARTPNPMSFLSKVCGRENDVGRPRMLIVAGCPDEATTIPDHSTKKKDLDEIANFL